MARTVSGTNMPFAAVMSGSMEPTIPTGSLLFIQKVSGEEIVAGEKPIGDVIVFYFPNTKITDYFLFAVYDPVPWSHRAIDKEEINGKYYILTKGEAKLFPKFFERINAHGVPGIANIVVFLGLLPCILFSGTAWIQTLFVIMGLGIASVYLGATLSFLKLRKSKPEWKRPYRVPAGYLVGILGVFASIFCVYWSAMAMTLEGWYLTIAYLIVGAILYYYSSESRKRKGIKPELKPPIQ